MSTPSDPATQIAVPGQQRFRRVLLIIDVGLLAFWPYSIAYIMSHPADKGSDGFEIFLAVPMTGIALVLSIPALLLLISDRTLPFSIFFTIAAFMTNVFFWSLIVWDGGLGHGHCTTFLTLCW